MNSAKLHDLSLAPGKKLPRLELSLRFGPMPAELLARQRAALARHRVARWIRHALQADAEIAVRILDEPQARALNRDWRRKDYATNVLTFDYAREPLVLADLVLCAPVVEREARQQGLALDAHYAHLLMHGTLHAQGWDHETGEREAQRMEARESELLARLGFADPYR